jgi:hypothetical protein
MCSLVIHHTLRTRHIVIYVRLYHISPHYLINGTIFKGEKKVVEQNVFYFLYN